MTLNMIDKIPCCNKEMCWYFHSGFIAMEDNFEKLCELRKTLSENDGFNLCQVFSESYFV